MMCLRIYATPDGESHFDEVEIPMQGRAIFPGVVPFELSTHYPSSRIRFTRIPAGIREVSCCRADTLRPAGLLSLKSNQLRTPLRWSPAFIAIPQSPSPLRHFTPLPRCRVNRWHPW
jgi:hypothetical protein